MSDLLFDRLTLRKLPTGRRAFACARAKQQADALGEADIAAAAQACVDHDTHTLELEAQWDEVRGLRSQARGDTGELDAEADALIKGMFKIADGQTSSPTPAKAAAAKTYLDAVHPLGLAPTINQAYEDQLAWMRTMIERFNGPLASAVAALGMDDHAGRLEPLADEYAAELSKNDDSVTFDEVREARIEGLELLAKLVFEIMATTSDDPQKRDKLMAEIDRQDELVAKAYRENRYPKDIDPQTGEPVGDADADVVEPEPEPTEV